MSPATPCLWRCERGEHGLREIVTHKVDGLNEAVRIVVLDRPGQGNACHVYRLVAEGQRDTRGLVPIAYDTTICFQNGPMQAYGVNGISNEALLAVVRDRLEGFQSGPYACHENANALEGVMQAMQWLRVRTESRVVRGVEGTSQA